MSYLIAKTVKRIFRNKRMYYFIFFEMVVGIFILNISLTTSFFLDKKYDELKEEGKNMVFEIEASHIDNAFILDFNLLEWGKGQPIRFEYDSTELCPFNQDDIAYIEEKYNDELDILFHIRRDIIHFDPRSHNAETYFLFFVSDGFLEHFKNIDPDRFDVSNTAFIGPDFLDFLTVMNGENTVNPRDVIFTYSDDNKDEIRFADGHTLKIDNTEFLKGQDLDFLFKGYEPENKEKFSYGNIAILPLKYYYDYFHPKDVIHFDFSVKFYKAEDIYEIISAIYDYFDNAHGDIFYYTLDNSFDKYLRLTEDSRNNALLANVVMSVTFILVVFGLTGLLLLMLGKRSREIAVSLAVGARKTDLYIELFLESILITLSGGLTGCVFSVIMLKANILKINETIIGTNCMAVLISWIVPILVGLVSSIPLMFKVRKMLPLQIIRNS